jgi:hypothetical protein
VTIIAASIPFLRLGFKEVHKRTQGTSQGDYYLKRMSRSGMQGTHYRTSPGTVTDAGARQPSREEDSRSDRSILGKAFKAPDVVTVVSSHVFDKEGEAGPRPGRTGIMQTSVISVEISEAGSSKGANFGMRENPDLV